MHYIRIHHLNSKRFNIMKYIFRTSSILFWHFKIAAFALLFLFYYLTVLMFRGACGNLRRIMETILRLRRYKIWFGKSIQNKSFRGNPCNRFFIITIYVMHVTLMFGRNVFFIYYYFFLSQIPLKTFIKKNIIFKTFFLIWSKFN